MACLVQHYVSNSGSLQRLPGMSLYVPNVLIWAVLSCGSVAGDLLVCFPIWPNVTADAPLLPKCLSFFLNLTKVFPSVLSHYSSAFPPDIPSDN